MGSVFGKNIKLSLFGESHGEAIGCVIDDFPHGIKIDNDFIESEIERRRAKNPNISTTRNEKDKVEILSGLLENKTTGMPIAAIIRNENKRSGDYSNLKIMPCPSHSDLTAMIRYENYNDIRGGGHFSGRLTAPLVFAGALCKLALKEKFNINIAAHIKQIYNIKDKYPNNKLPSYKEFIKNYKKELSVFDNDAMNEMIKTIKEAKINMDSVGGIITVVAFDVPAGFGEPFYSSIESRIAESMFGVPAVKGIEFGLGFDFVNYKGSECNDAYIIKNNKIKTEVSIDEPINTDSEGNDLSLADILGTDNDSIFKHIEEGDNKKVLEVAIRKLNDREKNIMEMRFGFISGKEKTQKEVADELGISQSYISRLEKKIINKMKKDIMSKTG